MFLPLKMWFDPIHMPDRRKPHNRLRRIAVDSDHQQEAQIQRWLELGDAALADNAEPPRLRIVAGKAA